MWPTLCREAHDLHKIKSFIVRLLWPERIKRSNIKRYDIVTERKIRQNSEAT